MTKWTEAKLKREAANEHRDCYECGHYPDWTNEPLTDELAKDWADEYDMTPAEFKQYVKYFYACSN